MTRPEAHLVPWANGFAPSRLRRESEAPPWPPAAIPWGLSWACAEMELQEELRATRTKLRRFRRQSKEARVLGFSDQFQRAARDAVKLAAARVAVLKTDLRWAAAALSCGTVEAEAH